MAIRSKLILRITSAIVLAMGALSAHAHTVAVATINTGTQGEVALWLGTYHSGSPNEGAMTLNGTTMNFNMTSSTVPAGAVAGSTLFFSPCGALASCPANQGDFDQTTNNTGQSIIRSWQGVIFSGLAAGTYTYQITGMNTINWSDWNSGLPNWTGQLTITGAAVGTAPEPGSLALLALGLTGIGARSLRKRRAA